jgi:hypothetical protein
MKLRCLFLASMCVIGAGVRADTEHDRIADERSAANAKLIERERECATRFIVADCLESARRDNRATLSRLRHQELQLDDARRQAIAEARRKATAEKAEATQARANDAAADTPGVRLRRDPPVKAPEAAPTSNADPKRRMARPQPSASEKQRLEQRSGAEYEARIRAANAHRATAEKRSAERAAKGKVVAPLPMPSAASTPR